MKSTKSSCVGVGFWVSLHPIVGLNVSIESRKGVGFRVSKNRVGFDGKVSNTASSSFVGASVG